MATQNQNPRLPDPRQYWAKANSAQYFYRDPFLGEIAPDGVTFLVQQAHHPVAQLALPPSAPPPTVYAVQPAPFSPARIAPPPRNAWPPRVRGSYMPRGQNSPRAAPYERHDHHCRLRRGAQKVRLVVITSSAGTNTRGVVNSVRSNLHRALLRSAGW
ncbi:hypothetical protein B0H10DRAFT_2441450 [Mycena sp. CBHHK59/15]|nr:hypothetical protein B0H10DRAFT_2441450 [Mycena sp. CBHHK59/15]